MSLVPLTVSTPACGVTAESKHNGADRWPVAPLPLWWRLIAVFTNENSSVRFVHARRCNASWELPYTFPSDRGHDGKSDQEERKYISTCPWYSRGEKEFGYMLALKEIAVACEANHWFVKRALEGPRGISSWDLSDLCIQHRKKIIALDTSKTRSSSLT